MRFTDGRFDYVKTTAMGNSKPETITCLSSLTDVQIQSIEKKLTSGEYGSKSHLLTLADVYAVGSEYMVAVGNKDLMLSQHMIDFRKFRTDYFTGSMKDACDTMDAFFKALGLPYSANNGRCKALASFLGYKKSHKSTTGNVDIGVKDDRSFYVEVCRWLYRTFQIKFTAKTTYVQSAVTAKK